MDATEFDVLYHDLPSYQREFVADLTMAEETKVVFPSMLSTKPNAPHLNQRRDNGGFDDATNFGYNRSQGNYRPDVSDVVEPAFSGVVTSPTSLVAGVLVSMKTPPRLPAIPRPCHTSVSATSSSVVMVKPVEGLSLGITRSPGVIEAEKEFVAEMVNSFYKSLKRSITLILKGPTTSFAALKVVLSHNFESI